MMLSLLYKANLQGWYLAKNQPRCYFLSLIFAFFFAGCIESLAINELVAYYSFNNGDAKDESGRGNHGEIKGAVFVNDRYGSSDGALYFDGTNAHVYIQGSPDFFFTNHTISAWVKIDRFHDTSGVIFSTLDNLWSNGGIQLALLYSRNTFSYAHRTITSSVESDTPPILRNNKNSWNHLVATYEHSEGYTKIGIFLNGFLIKYDELEIGPLTYKGQDAFIGVNYDSPITGGSLSGRSFLGSLDDLRIFSRALSEDEVNQLYLAESLDMISDPNSVYIEPIAVSGYGSYVNSAALIVDGFKPAESSVWSGPYSAWWINDKTVEFIIDLGQVWSIHDVAVSLDDNDSYALSYSIDGIVYSNLFHVLSNMGETPWGIETISTIKDDPEYIEQLDFSPIQSRYVKISATDGDNSYAIAEVSIYGSQHLPAKKSGAIYRLSGHVVYSLQATGNCQVMLKTENLTPIKGGLSAFYPLDGSTQDISGNQHHLSGIGVTTTSNRFGQDNKAALFSGLAYLRSAGRIPALEGDDHSIAAWVKSVSSNSSTIAGYVSDEAFRAGDSGFKLAVDSNGYFAVAQGSASATGIVEFASADARQAGDGFWHFLVGVRTGGVTRLYVDGVLQSHVITNAPSFSDHTRLYIGSDTYRSFIGAIDDVTIYDRGLEEWEVAVLYHHQTNRLISVSPPGPSPFTFDNLSKEILYSIEAFVDVESNGLREAWEPYASYSNNPIDMSKWEVTNTVHLQLIDPDLDGDGLAGYLELFTYGTTDDDPDYDDDGFDDHFEATHPLLDATSSNDDVVNYIKSNPRSFSGLYTTSNIADLSLGYALISQSNGSIRLSVGVEETSYLGDEWTSRDPAIIWESPASTNINFYRIKWR